MDNELIVAHKTKIARLKRMVLAHGISGEVVDAYIAKIAALGILGMMRAHDMRDDLIRDQRIGLNNAS